MDKKINSQEKWQKTKNILIKKFHLINEIEYVFEKEEDFKHNLFKNSKILILNNHHTKIKFLFCPKETNDMLSICLTKKIGSKENNLWLTDYWSNNFSLDSSFFDLNNIQGNFDDKINKWSERIVSFLKNDKKIKSVLEGEKWISYTPSWEKD